MADNNDSFDEFLNRAEEDYDAGDIEAAEAGDEDDVLNDVEGGEDESRPGAFVSEENKARSLIDMSSIANPHGSIVEGANGGEGTIVRSAYLGKEMQTSFLEYAMSVIVSRALPDVRDGLKPVHRRILYAMNESGYTPNRPHMKSARTVGDVIGKYHPHGDSAVYNTMVRLAQPFSMRVPLVDGHGNFGSIDGDGAAAMRYTESRLDKVAMELLRDLDKETVDFQPNYDESLEEPTVLPARFPNLLVNGSQGIAVGMATNIPPHNLGETIDATCLMLDNPDVTTEELMKALPGPDFPTGGIIMGKKGIRDAYETGRGSLTVRAKCKVEEGKNGRSSIVVTEIPYQVNRQRLLEKLGELVREKKLPEISNIHDGADRHGIDIIIDLKKDAIPQVVLNKLYKHTQLQVGFGVIMLSLVDGAPRVLSLKEMLHYYIAHQEEVIVRRTRYELAKAEERAHILEGLIIALDNIDEVIHIIRSSQTDKEAAERMTERFGLTDKQTAAILEMRLRRLTGLEHQKIEDELKELLEKIAYFKRVLSDDQLVHDIIKEELSEVKKKFGSPRRTLLSEAAKDLDVEDLIAEESMVVTMTKAGYVKRLPVATYRQQKRGGKGMSGVNLKDNDYVEHLFVASTHSYMLFFSTKGKVYRLKVYELPEASRHARGTAIVNLLPLENHLGRHRDEGLPVRRVPHVRHRARHGEEDVDGPVRPHAPRRPDRHQPEGQRPPHFGEARGSGREGAHGVQRRQGHHVGRGRSTCHGPRHHGRARHERAAHRQGAGHGDRAARYRPVRHHREGLRQAHPHRRVPRAPSRRPGRVHHHDDREEGPAGRHEDRRRRRRDHDYVRGRRVRAHPGVGHLRARPFHAGRVRDEDGRQGPRDRSGHLQPRQEEESLRRAGGRRGAGRERHR